MAIDFPNSPTNGQTFTVGDTTWVYQNSVWNILTSSAAYSVCTSSTRPSAPGEGRMIYETDTNRVLVYNGSSWKNIVDLDTPPAMVLLDSTTLSATSSVNIDNVFSSDFDDYMIRVRCSSSAGGSTFGLRLRTSTPSDASGTYAWQELFANSTTISGGATSGTGGWRVGANDTNGRHSMLINLFGASAAVQTSMQSSQQRNTGTLAEFSWGDHNQATAYAGFTFFVGSGNMTGTIRTYGFRNSI
jgi:hypothetical protein